MEVNTVATIRKTNDGKFSVRFRDHNGKTRELYGYLKKSTATEHGAKLDRCIALLKRGDELDARLQGWLDEIPDSMYSKLAKWGIVKARVKAGTLAELIEIFVTGEQSRGMKPNTLRNREQVGKQLISFFGKNRPVDSIREKDAREFYEARQRIDAPGTWGRNIKTVKQFFRYAVKSEWIKKNPFNELKGANVANTSRFYRVTNEMFVQILAHCRNSQERLFLVLARYGGLRIPSELQFMEWGDFHVAEGFFVVKTPKKEKKINQDRGYFTDYATRRVPLFPEIEEAFQEYFEDFPEGGPKLLFSEDPRLPVPFRVAVTSQGLTSRLKKVVRRAGLKLWEKPFQNLRSTRETELAEQGWPIQDVTSWLGNTPNVAAKHYLQTSPALFKQAQKTRTNTQTNTRTEGKEVQVEILPSNLPLILPPQTRSNYVNTNDGENEGSDENPENTGENQAYSRNEKSRAITRTAQYYPLGAPEICGFSRVFKGF